MGFKTEFLHLTGAALHWTCAEDVRQCQRPIGAWIILLVLVHNLNRWLTLYITLERTKAVWTVTGGVKADKKTKNRVLWELSLYGIAGSIPLWLVCWGLIKLLDALNVREPFSVGCLIVYPILITAMVIMAAIILYQTKSTNVRRSTSEIVTSRRNADPIAEFQKQVASVAFVFCSCQVLSLVRNGLIALDSHGPQKVGDYHLDTLNAFLNIFNSSINIVIYVVVSPNFRRISKKCWKKIFNSAKSAISFTCCN